jgi:hypothetical protein
MASFSAMYEKVRAAGLVYENPRFPHLVYATLEDALERSEFRVMDIVDPQTGETLYTLEHEIRCPMHAGFCCSSFVTG